MNAVQCVTCFFLLPSLTELFSSQTISVLAFTPPVLTLVLMRGCVGA